MCSLFRVAAFILACGLCGCAQTQLEHQSDAVNRASATTIAEHTLLNVVRASLDLPMSFTKLQKFTSENMAKGSLTPKLPFGLDAPKIFDLGPSLNWSSGVSSIEYVDANTAGALAKLNQTLPYDTIDRYKGEGLPFLSRLTLFVGYLEVHEDLVSALKNRFQAVCLRPRPDSSYKPICDELVRIASPAVCERHWFERRSLEISAKQKFAIVLNDATTKCNYLWFQSAVMNLGLAEFGAEPSQDETFDTMLTPEQKRVPVAKSKSAIAVRFQIKEVQDKFAELELKSKLQKGRPPLTIQMRSPRSLLTYLGQLIALQNYPKDADKLRPQVFGDLKGPITLFNVIHGSPDRSGAALAVRGPHGDTYFVPHPDYGSYRRDRTLVVLSMAAEVVNSAISDKDLPAPASIVVRAIQ